MRAVKISVRRSANRRGDRYDKVHLEVEAELEPGDEQDTCINQLADYVRSKVELIAEE